MDITGKPTSLSADEIDSPAKLPLSNSAKSGISGFDSLGGFLGIVEPRVQSCNWLPTPGALNARDGWL